MSPPLHDPILDLISSLPQPVQYDLSTEGVTVHVADRPIGITWAQLSTDRCYALIGSRLTRPSTLDPRP